MFTYLRGDGVLGIRLEKSEREKFVHLHYSPLFESHGSVMKEYVSVPDELLKKMDEMKRYIQMSYDYVSSLKPKKQRNESSLLFG